MNNTRQAGSRAEVSQAKVIADFPTARQELFAAAAEVPAEHRDTVFH